ncbi:MAG: right-handed parallel beta-helix repeat-containing protein [Nitrospirota bacterium]
MTYTNLCICFLALLLPISTELNAATYYFACDTGNDANTGLSQTQPWQSVAKASHFEFSDGDKVLFKKGCTWEDVSIKVSHSISFGAYGDAPEAPHLIGATKSRSWTKLNSKSIFYTQAAIEPGSPGIKEILIVHDGKHGKFYKTASTLESLDSAGMFFHDVARNVLYIAPLEGTNLQHEIHFSSKPHIFEYQQVNVERVIIDGLQLSFANEYAIGFWYQSSGTRNGSLRVENCTFFGNAHQALHIGGTNSFRNVDIVANTITANGNEGIYIGHIKGSEEGDVVTGTLRISSNLIGGLGFGWRSMGAGSAANGEGIDIKKGVRAAIIDNNRILDLNGFFGIAVQSSNVVIENNTIQDIHMTDATPDSGIAAIIVDAYDNKGSTIVRRNTITVESANGIAIRGHAERHPRVEVYENKISVAAPYFPFAFTSQNVTNATIRDNSTKGGRAGLGILKPCCRPANIEFHNNDIQGVSSPLLAAQDVSVGARIHSNIFCLKEAYLAIPKDLARNNIFKSNCISPATLSPSPPQGVRIQ